jgi:hypothetical protein
MITAATIAATSKNSLLLTLGLVSERERKESSVTTATQERTTLLCSRGNAADGVEEDGNGDSEQLHDESRVYARCKRDRETESKDRPEK